MTQEKNICTDLGAAFRMKPFYWWSVILTAVSCYGFTLTHHSKGVDDVHMILYFEWKELLRQGRFGTEFLMPFLDISDFIPFWVDFTAVCLFVLGAWLWSRVFLSSMKQKSYAAATIFSCLLISCPYIAHMFVFMPTTIPFGMILVLSGSQCGAIREELRETRSGAGRFWRQFRERWRSASMSTQSFSLRSADFPSCFSEVFSENSSGHGRRWEVWRWSVRRQWF